MEKQRVIITIGRQIGAGGKKVAAALSGMLDIPMYDSELLEIAARRSGCDRDLFERVDEKKKGSLLTSLFSRPSPTAENTHMDSFISNENLFQIQSTVIREIAAEGSAIFVGRCADYILRDDPDLISVFITSPLSERVKTNAQRYNVSEDVSQRYIEHDERKRTSYYNFYTFKKWGDSSSYDLCINSSILGIEGTAQYIVEFIRRRQEAGKR